MSKEQESIFPDQQFKQEYPEHAERVSMAIHDWYQFAANFYTGELAIPTLRASVGQFLHNALGNPQNVLINNVPLSFALPEKSRAMVSQLGQLPPSVLIESFVTWFNQNLTNDINPEKRVQIEEITKYHIYAWLNSLEQRFKNDVGVWDQVDTTLEEYIKSGILPHILGVTLVDEIKFSIFEQFMTDTYAPKDLFGTKID